MLNAKFKINHKLFIPFFVTGVLAFSIIKINNYIKLEKQINETNLKIQKLKDDALQIKNKLIESSNKSKKISDLSYYASNIYAYCLLEDIEVEIKNGPSKYKDSLQLIIVHKELEKQKHQNFLNALSLMGFIEDVKKDGFVLNVYEYSISDAKKEIQKIISK
mgnify:CR=1 FL=1